MAEWTTEKEFDYPSTAQKGVTTNVQVSTTKLTDRQRKILEAIKNNTTNIQVNVQVNDQVNVQKLATLLGFSEKAIDVISMFCVTWISSIILEVIRLGIGR